MLLRHGFLAALLLLVAPALAQRDDGANKILYPDVTGLTFHYMDSVDVKFETDYSTPWMYIFCNLSNGYLQEVIYYSPSDVENSDVRPFTLNYTYMLESQCWFNLRSAQRDEDDDNTLEGATSPAWTYNTTEGSEEVFALGSTVTSGAGTASSTSTGNASAGTASPTASTTASGLATASNSGALGTVTATVTSQPSGSPDSSSSGGLSTGAKAGIGAGVGCAGLAALAAAAFLLYRRRQKTAGPGQGFKLDSPRMATTEKALPPTPAQPATVQPALHELSPSRDYHEMALERDYHELQ